MQTNIFKSRLIVSGFATSVLLLASGASFAQQQINLTAAPATATLPDGSTVPMWGYSCGAAATGSTATCGPLNPSATTPGAWSPVVITIPTGQDLQINLTNNLSFTPTGSTTPNIIPTSLVIVGQLGGGLGTPASAPSPTHAPQGATWPITGDTTGATFTPPTQGSRVQSFATEVATGATTSLTWTAPRPGTYLIESGTHPSIQGPMGLYGILVVTQAPSGTSSGTAYPGVSYAADVPLLLSEIDPMQNGAVQATVASAGFSETSARVLRDSVSSLSLPLDANGNAVPTGSGYSTIDTITFSPTAACATQPAAVIDSVTSTGAISAVHLTASGSGCTQVPTVGVTSSNPSASGAQLTAALSLAGVMCSDGAAACYPPAVNYTPLYYLINGVAFDKTNPSLSLFPNPSPTSVTGSVLVRLVNAGLRMHVPSIVGATTGTAQAPGLSLIAEDGNVLPGVTRVQSEVFMPAGKTYDVMVNPPCTPVAPATTCAAPALPIFDRELSLSANSVWRDGGMLAYIGINGAGVPAAPAIGAAVARNDTYNALVAGQTLTVSDPAKGVIANDTNVYGVKLLAQAANGTVTLNADGTFKYVPGGTGTSDSFTYCANGTVTGTTCSSGVSATVTLGASSIVDSGITCTAQTFTASTNTYLAIKPPGVLAGCTDGANLPITVATSTVTASGMTVLPDANGGFTATATGAGTYTFTFRAQNTLGLLSSDLTSTSTTPVLTTTVTVTFPTANGPTVTVLDGVDKTTVISDYRWIIEEDRTFYVDPNCTQNPLPASCPTVNNQKAPAVFGTNFHTSWMPMVATGCTGPLSCEGGQTQQGIPVVCDQGNGICRPDTTGNGQMQVFPSQVNLDPTKRYYISVLPGDAAQPFIAGYAGAPDCSPAGVAAGSCGHGMGGAPISAGQTSVTVLTQPSPYPPAKLSVFVFEDDWPLNGEHNAGGGIDTLSPQEPGLGGFQITLFDDAGGTGDATGQPTYDMFNMPLTNSLAGTIDPVTGYDACPISPAVTANVQQAGPDPKHPTINATPAQCSADPTLRGCQKGIVGMIVTCPTYESDGVTLSPLAGQAVVNNLYQGRYGVVATPGADRIAKGEEWLQTNTLDGQKAHDSFMRIGEPAYFQEFGPAGYHVSIGFANPKIINARNPGGSNELKGHVTTARMSRPPDERLYGSGSRDSFAFTQCYASLGDPDGADFAFVKCDDQGNFDFTGVPAGNFKLTIFDQWNDQIVDGISTPVGLTGTNTVLDMGEVAVHQWQANIYTRTFLDLDGNGVSSRDTTGTPCTAPNVPAGCNANYGNETEPGLPLVATNIRFRDGSFSNFNNTDLNGYAGFNEVFPLFSWYVIETDSTRYKSTGVHVVVDSGGPTDGTTGGGTSLIAQNLANTIETISLPGNLRVPGAVYCANADCTGSSIATGPVVGGSSGPTTGLSTGRIDPPSWFGSYGWQGFSGQNSFLEFGKKPFADGENGGIHGHVVYASTRPFDDPQLLLQLSWEPLVPHVRVNLYKEGFASDGITPTLTLVDHTETSSFDDWAQGFHLAADGVTKIPNMNCPGQALAPTSTTPGDSFFYGLQNQPNYLDWYNSQHGGPAATLLPNNSQFKCYDGMHNWNQLQPAPYDGMYSFPSVTSINPTTGKPASTNCTACTTNPDTSDPYRSGLPMLPAGKYVVEVAVPPGYELVKEEDKNILIGDNFIAPVTTQFGGLGNIFILPDQAEVASACNATSSPQNPTCNLGRVANLPSHEGDTGSVESFWPCVGAARQVPDYISLFPGSAEVAPFAGAVRNLCDRKEITLTDQSSALAKFYIFTSTHVASHFTGVITDDFTAEFDPFSPQFGEKFAPAYLPVSIKDWTGNEIGRTYSDQWGAYNGLNYSTWEVNPPNPTGYGPTMMVVCMNDRGPGVTPDPLFQPNYSQFCYELPFMPGQTGYFDTPVVPTSSFSEGYNHPDCNYADATPAISEVDGDGIGPWVSAAGKTLTIKALGDQLVDNYAYSGPSQTAAPFNQKKVTRHYGFGGTAGTVSLVSPPNAAGATTTVNLTVSGNWTDTQITATIPTLSTAFNCPVQQQAQYGGPGTTGVTTAQCGQLVITAANGKQSIDTVTVTIGGKTPTHVGALSTIQSAIDIAMPGDLIIIDPICTRGNSPKPVDCNSPGNVTQTPISHNEMLIMWKPVRLQGVGAASTIIDANTQPAAKLLNPWRSRINCLFGLTPDGRPRDITDNSCAQGWNAASGGPYFPTMIVDRLPFEALLGWDTTLNGNLAEQLIEPSLMGAYEGAAITVLGKGVMLQQNDPDPFGAAVGSAYTAGTTLLLAGNCGSNTTTATNPYPGNFYCNPSSIDGLGIQNSSQGGGGIFVHAFAHNIQIGNNRVSNNSGTLTGGITIGQGEHADVALAGAALTSYPGSCENSIVPNLALPFCYNMRVNVHHNSVTLNNSMGDELFSSTPAGAGGVSFCTGADYYNFNHNWVCGNLSTGDGGGVAHIGFTKNGTIEHNQILFNQSTNPTITTNGGGLLVMGAPDVDPPCSVNDQDCVSPPGTIAPSDGTGPGLVINANLILGNAADSGSGGGLRLQHINGNDVVNFPNGTLFCLTPAVCAWNTVSVTNNIIANNVAGWDGAGVSLQDALATNIVNNTIVSNDSTASSGVLFGSLFAPLASTPGTNCTTNNGASSCPQVAGLVSVTNSPVLQANLPTSGFSCPPGHGTSGSCRYYSVPLLYNDVIWQNRSFFIGVGGFGTGQQNQQKVVTLYNSFTTTPAPSQPQTDATAANGNGLIVTGGTGACTSASYWEIGVRGDTGPSNHVVVSGATLRLSPNYSVLTDAVDYTGANNTAANPTVLSQYCNGSRVPPELGSMGFQVPPGTNEGNALPTPVFSLTPSATVDEGNNWINMRWGPLALRNISNGALNGSTLGNYGPAPASPVINYIPSSALMAYALAPSTDFYGTLRKTNNAVDAGAVEFVSPNIAIANVTGGPLAFGNVVVGTTSAPQTLTLHNAGGAPLTTINVTVTAPFARAAGGCGTTLAAGATCAINVTFTPTSTGSATGTVTITASVPVAGSPVSLSGTGIAANRTATVAPSPLAFGNWAVGTTSNARTLTVTNTGNVSLTSVTISGLAPPFSRPTAGGTCSTTTTLAVAGTCTINLVFAPTATGNFTGSPTVVVGSATVTPTPVSLTGTGVAARATVSITPNPLTITLPSGTLTGTGTVTLTNTAAAGSSQVAITNVAVTGSGLIWSWTKGTDNCTGAALAPGATCTVGTTFSRIGSVGTHTGAITFTDTATGSPQFGVLTGVAQ